MMVGFALGNGLSSGLEVICNGLAEGGPVVQVTLLGGMGRVPSGFQSQVDGIRGRVLRDPVFANATPERMIAGSGDTDLLGKTQGMFAQGLQAMLVEALLVRLAPWVQMGFGGTEEERFAIPGARVVQVEE